MSSLWCRSNPLDAFVSFFKFLPDYDGLEPGDITMEQVGTKEMTCA